MTKKALVTGASEGIGNAFARKLAKEGYEVTIVARTESKLKDLAQTMGPKHSYLVADLSTDAGQTKVAERLKAEHYDLMINNAGVATVGGFTKVPLEKQKRMLSLNCQAVMVLSYAYLESAKAGDTLVNVSSTLAFLPLPAIGLYSATKAFVTSFSESLWYEQKERGIYVMGLCPGITSTNFQVNSGGSPADVPQGMAQTPEEVVEVAYKAIVTRKNPTVISGIKNRVFAGISRAIPRKSTVSMMGKMGSKTMHTP